MGAKGVGLGCGASGRGQRRERWGVEERRGGVVRGGEGGADWGRGSGGRRAALCLQWALRNVSDSHIHLFCFESLKCGAGWATQKESHRIRVWESLGRMCGQECNIGSRGDAPDRMSHLGDEILGVAAIEDLLVQF